MLKQMLIFILCVISFSTVNNCTNPASTNQHTDTVIIKDSSWVFKYDTVRNYDTVIRYDTTWLYDTVHSYDTVFSFDTIFCKDTLQIIYSSRILTETVTLGAQQSPIGSSLDIDKFMVYTLGSVPSADIDLYYGIYPVTNGVPMLYSPSAIPSDFSAYLWTNKNICPMAKVALSDSQWNKIVFQSQIDSLWPVQTYYELSISVGDIIIIQSNQDIKYLLRVSNLIDGKTGTIELKGIKNPLIRIN